MKSGVENTSKEKNMAFGVAVVGLQHWYTAFSVIETVAASEKMALVGIAELRPERLAQAKEKFAAHTVTDDADELIGRDDVHLVALGCTTAQAPELAAKALRAGKHVISVKPPARTLAELDAPLTAAKESGKFYGSFEGLAAAFAPRPNPARHYSKRRDRDADDLLSNRTRRTASPWPGETGPSWWVDETQVPGGAWIDHSIYSVDLARFVFGGEIDSVSGIIENRVTPEIALEDYGVSLMRLKPDNGGPSVSLIFEDTWSAKPGFGVHRNEIIGTEGRIVAEGNEWVVHKSGGDVTRHAIPGGPFFNMEAFVAALETGAALPFGPADARANLAACLSVYASAAR